MSHSRTESIASPRCFRIFLNYYLTTSTRVVVYKKSSSMKYIPDSKLRMAKPQTVSRTKENPPWISISPLKTLSIKLSSCLGSLMYHFILNRTKIYVGKSSINIPVLHSDYITEWRQPIIKMYSKHKNMNIVTDIMYI
jgi:hypothetical protein